MARAYNIFVVQSKSADGDWEPIRAFTVKYELIIFLRARPGADSLRVTKVSDGLSSSRSPKNFTVKELLEG